MNYEYEGIGIGSRIRRLRQYNDLTLNELANKVGVSKQTIQRYETGVIANIPSDRIECMASALGVEPSELMGWEKPIYIPDEEEEVVEVMHKLDKDNKKILTTYAKRLLAYQNSKDELLNAAHAIDGASEEDKKHDEDIMDNF